MCLIVQDNKIIKTAEKDIVCYKIIEEYRIMHPLAVAPYYAFLREHGFNEKDAKYVTPIMFLPVVFGYEYNEPDFKNTVIEVFDLQRGFGNERAYFHGDMYHSYAEKDDSFYALTEIKSGSLSHRVLRVAECIIPKGANYIVGIDDSRHLKCYGSEKIIYKELIEL